jgi:hypothetical protein
MMNTTTTAKVHSFTVSQFRRKHARTATGGERDTQSAEASIFSDMSDGMLALDFALTFARCNYDARQLTLSIIGLLGDEQKDVAMYDGELAAHIKCSERTVRRYRTAALAQQRSLHFALIEITEGEYLPAEKRYAPTRYKLADGVREYVEATIKQAREATGYTENRNATIEKAAKDNYGDIPNAPPPAARNRKPKRSESVLIERDFINAEKNLAKGQSVLNDLPEHTRTAFLAGAQGEDLRALLLKMQGEISYLLKIIPQTADSEDVSRGYRTTWTMDSDGQSDDGRDVFDDEATCEDETRVRVLKERTRTLVPMSPAEAEAAWSNTFAGTNAPSVRVIEVEIRAAAPVEGVSTLVEPPELIYEFDTDDSPSSSDESAEAEAIQRKANGLPLEPGEPVTDIREAEDSPSTPSSPPLEPAASRNNSPESENPTKTDVMPQGARHGFGARSIEWGFPTASGKASYAPGEAKP